jgi:thymidylate synthase (FAD)
VMDPLQDGKSSIVLIDSLGNDLSIVNDARTSYDRQSASFTDEDRKLLLYLIKHQHTSPFRGVVFKFRVKAPLFICRQWWKHVIASSHNDEQLGWNEKSIRYTECTDPNDFYVPDMFRLQSTINKQSSEGELTGETARIVSQLYARQCRQSFTAYQTLLDYGVGREQARGVLVPSVYTTWVWTASLQSTLHLCSLRLGKGAQSEITRYAESIVQLIEPIVPETIKLWTEEGGF